MEFTKNAQRIKNLLHTKSDYLHFKKIELNFLWKIFNKINEIRIFLLLVLK